MIPGLGRSPGEGNGYPTPVLKWTQALKPATSKAALATCDFKVICPLTKITATTIPCGTASSIVLLCDWHDTGLQLGRLSDANAVRFILRCRFTKKLMRVKLAWVHSTSLPLLLSHYSFTVAHQATPSMGFSRQEHWRELPFPSPGFHVTCYY